MRTMVICIAVSAGGGVRYVAVSLPLVEALVDGRKYRIPGEVKPPQEVSAPPQETSRTGAHKRGFEQTRRAPRAPTLRSMVKLALRCQSAEEMGKQLKRRFDRSLVRRGIDPNRRRDRQAEAERLITPIIRGQQEG